ncbi:MAG TPA: peptidoglycan-binding protein [Jatrophihabitans sp.]|nr:peptidoglycan-binding protein [Jatrophihabitans sp.]
MGIARETSFFADWTRANTAAGPDRDRVRGRSRRGRARLVGAGLLATSVAAASIVLPSATASADPSATTWYRLRMCESSNNYSTNTGNAHYGAYQFDLATWRSVGGSGYPNKASKAEQDARALILYRMRGWQPWQCAGILGLREDKDARSGRTSDIKVPRQASSPSHGIPAFPGGSHWYRYGETSRNIKTFQDQMHKRGYFPVGTGQYGPNTLAMVKQLQRLNGLIPNGFIGPNTWRLAWTGKYTPPKTSTAKPTTSTSSRVPAFPGGSHWYRYGETSRNIKTFQDQMHKRGYFPVGVGYYGPNTLAMVKQLQRLNGLVPNGLIGPNTWRLAWTGKYTPPRTSASAIPPFPGGSHWYRYGETSWNIKVFQDQMHKRGYFPVGVGYYGTNTLRMVKQLQRLNGLVPNGLIGPNTWRLAWTGRYRAP